MRKNNLNIALLAITLCVTLTGCQGSDYKEAITYEERGEYETALEIFETIPDYKESSKYIKECKTMIQVRDNFTKEEIKVETINKKLDTVISVGESKVTTKEYALDDTLKPALETAISDAKSAKYTIPEMALTEDEIVKQIDNLKAVNYDDVIKQIEDKQYDLEKSIKQYSLVNAPDESYILSCLKEVENVVDISAVTEENDPNGNLNKAGGYTSTVYFSSDLVDQSEVEGETIIDKGTQAGGGIEVYTTPEDAQKRNDYLASFDGGVFASGSHMVIGTVIVRTSDKLTASNQKNLEEAIIERLVLVKE